MAYPDATRFKLARVRNGASGHYFQNKSLASTNSQVWRVCVIQYMYDKAVLYRVVGTPPWKLNLKNDLL